VPGSLTVSRGAKPKDEATTTRQKRVPGSRPEDENSNPLARMASGTSLPVRQASSGIVTRGTVGRMGEFSAFPTSSGDELPLGTPLMKFTSNSRTVRTSETKGDDKGEFQEGFFKMRPTETLRGREAGAPAGKQRKEQTSTGEEGWTSVGRRKSSHVEEEKSGRWEDRERSERRGKEGEIQERRNGAGRGRFTDHTWLRADGTESTERDPNSTANRGDIRNMSWRDRDAAKERSNREWGRGRPQDSRDHRAEADPEWMTSDEPQAPAKETKHTQEDFQRWKEQQRLRDVKSGSASRGDELETSPAKPPALTSKSTSAVPMVNKYGFGMFEDIKKAEPEPVEAQRPQLAKSKSRFNDLFKKDDPIPELMPTASPVNILSPGNPMSNADRQGFDIIMARLNEAKSTPPAASALASPPQEPVPHTSSPARHLHQQSRERLSSENQRQRRGDPFFDEMLARQMSAQERSSSRQQPAMPPVAANILENRGAPNYGELQELQRTLREHNGQTNVNHNTEFLLSLMNRGVAQQAPRRMNEMPEFAGQFGPPKGGAPTQQHQGPAHAQMMGQLHSQAAPPGLEHHQRMLAEQHQEQLRRLHGGPPQGFFEHEGGHGMGGPMGENIGSAPPPGLARRNTSDAANGLRAGAPPQASNLGIPSMHNLPPGLNMMMLQRGAPAGPTGPGGPMPGGPSHQIPPPGLMTQGPQQGGQHPSGPNSAGIPPNMPNGRGENMRGPGGPGPMGLPPGFQGGMLPPGMGGQIPPHILQGLMQNGPGNGPPMGFPPGMAPPGFFAGMGPNGPGPSGPGGPGMGPGGPPGGPGMPPHFFGARPPPGFDAGDMRVPQPQQGGGPGPRQGGQGGGPGF
jgi:hypothetical protein